ncbi:MAG: hypothetical protein LBI12_06490 [Treponema sp.]|nr:hypothetical protein [Treponema sp.]
MSLPPLYLAAAIGAAVIIAFLCGFTVSEQIADLKPAAFYAVLMYALSFFSVFFENSSELPFPEAAAFAMLPRMDFLRIALRLVLIVQISALFFRSTSSIELRESLCTAENYISLFFSRFSFSGKHDLAKGSFSQNIVLFLMFIPEIFKNWKDINLAWKARSGKQGLKKIKIIVFVLISLTMEKAAVKSKALAARDV